MRRPVSRGYFERAQVELWLLELQSGNNSRAKRVLQEVESSLRRGWHFLPQDLRRVQQVFIGVLSDGSSDEKVRRWTLSALAKFAEKDVCYRAVTAILRDYPDEPQVVSAAIAALFAMDSAGTPGFLSKGDFAPPEVIFLSAVQAVSHTDVAGPKFILDPDKTEPMSLRLALIAAGLDRAPENLFHARHENRHLIKSLATHSDPIVAQYSVWATMESEKLNVADLGVDINSTPRPPVNIRGYIYRLYAKAPEATLNRHTVIEEGAWEKEVECRYGLATALKGQHYNGLEEIAVSWVYREVDEDTQDAILTYMASASEEVLKYSAICLELFEKAPIDSLRRKRIMSGAIKTPLYQKLKFIEIEEGDSLFRKSEARIVQNFNQTNNNPQGVISQGGNVTQGTQMNNMTVGFDANQLSELVATISHHLRNVQEANIPVGDAKAALLKLESQPTKENAVEAASALQRIGTLLKDTVDFGASAATLLEYAEKLSSFFPG